MYANTQNEFMVISGCFSKNNYNKGGLANSDRGGIFFQSFLLKVTGEEFNANMQKGLEEAKTDRVQPLDEAFAEIRRQFA